jgi:hypothetical protein
MALLDRYIPNPDITERHELAVHAPVDLVYKAACEFDMQSIPLARLIFDLRSRMMGSSRTSSAAPTPFLEEAVRLGWRALEQRPNEAVVMGAVCQPWQANVTFRPVPAEQFAAFSEGNLVKIAWTMETSALDGERSRLATETRAVATDATARARFLRYWRWARFGIIPIRWLVLPTVRRLAETAARTRTRTVPR